MKKLEGKIIPILGGSSGIGQGQAYSLAEEGATVIVMANKNVDGLKETVATITAKGGKADWIQVDSTKKADIDGAVKQILEKYGTIDVLCNTCGIFDNYKYSLDFTEEEWDHYFAVNVKSYFLMTNAVLPHFLEKGKGNIINLVSINGMTAGGGGAAYCATKHALIGYTKELCLEYAPKNIRVNAICPGSVATPLIQKSLEEDPSGLPMRLALIPCNRLGKPSDIGALTAFLASDEADWIHGACINIDGGRFAKG